MNLAILVQGPYSIWTYHLTSMGNPLVEDRFISTMGFSLLVRWHLYHESARRRAWWTHIHLRLWSSSYVGCWANSYFVKWNVPTNQSFSFRMNHSFVPLMRLYQQLFTLESQGNLNVKGHVPVFRVDYFSSGQHIFCHPGSYRGNRRYISIFYHIS